MGRSLRETLLTQMHTHTRTHTHRTIKRKESERQTGISDSSREWQRSPHKAKVNSFASPSITEQLREGVGGDGPLSAKYICVRKKRGGGGLKRNTVE